jgi:hypothetical protein
MLPSALNKEYTVAVFVDDPVRELVCLSDEMFEPLRSAGSSLGLVDTLEVSATVLKAATAGSLATNSRDGDAFIFWCLDSGKAPELSSLNLVGASIMVGRSDDDLDTP